MINTTALFRIDDVIADLENEFFRYQNKLQKDPENTLYCRICNDLSEKIKQANKIRNRILER